jgi:hypothetical protein
MGRYVIEHLPRLAARYAVVPLDYAQARAWFQEGSFYSLVRTTELISVIDAGMSVRLNQSDTSMILRAGDEALLVGVSFGVLLAWAQGQIAPLPEDWRCFSLVMSSAADEPAGPALEAAVVEDIATEGGVP